MNELFTLQISEFESSYINLISYNRRTKELEVGIRNFRNIVYEDVPSKVLFDFLESESKGNFYNTNIKSKFKTTKTLSMTDKTILFSIDLSKVNKQALVYGKTKMVDGVEVTPIYLNIKMLFSEKPDKYDQNGFVAQTYPKEYLKEHKGEQGKILGNCKDFTDFEREQLPKAGQEVEGSVGDDSGGASDDLPF